MHEIAAGKLLLSITRLEMKAPASVRPIDLAQGVTFRQITPTPAEYRDLFGRVGIDWLWYSRLKLTDNEISAHFAQPEIALFTLAKDGQDEAILELDFRVKGACEIAYFGLTPALIGTGAGRYLMNEAIRRAWTHPISRLHLHTCNYDSPQALDFYLRSGFTAYGRKAEVDDDPRLSGLVPETAAPHVPLIRP